MLAAYFSVFTVITIAALCNDKARNLVWVIVASWAVSFSCERLGMVIDRPLQVMAPSIDGLTFWAMFVRVINNPTREGLVAVRMMAFLMGVHVVFTGVLALGLQARFAYMWSINGVYLAVMLTLAGDFQGAWQRATSLWHRVRGLLSFGAGVFATPKGRYREASENGLERGVQKAGCNLYLPSSVEA